MQIRLENKKRQKKEREKFIEEKWKEDVKEETSNNIVHLKI